MKKPDPSYLGTGAAAKAGKAVSERNSKTKSRADAILQEINRGRTGTQNFKKCPDC